MTRARFKALTAGLLVMATLALGSVFAASAQAYSPDENFVISVYEDFLLRSPDNEEIAQGVIDLSSVSRTAFVTSILEQDEFVFAWIFTVYQRYIEREPTDTEFLTAVAALQSSGNYAQAEVTVLAAIDYFNASGGTNTDYVSALYQDLLYRSADPSGLSFYVGQLNAGTKTRSQVALTLLRSTEASTRRVAGLSGATVCPTVEFEDFSSISAGSYCIVLDRLADPSGQTYWVGQLSGSGQLPALWASTAGSTEYYNKAQL